MSSAVGPVGLLRIATDDNTHCLNYYIMAFVIPAFFLFVNQHPVSSPADLKKREGKRNDCARVSKPAMKVILFFAFQDSGIFMGHYCWGGPSNGICRKHTLFTSSLQKLRAQPWDRDPTAEGPSCVRQMGSSICESSTQFIIRSAL